MTAQHHFRILFLSRCPVANVHAMLLMQFECQKLNAHMRRVFEHCADARWYVGQMRERR